ncbi:M64 family metallopeptidase [Nonomuraea solani]|uniref:M64 family metallopeptidase n=1 Tax=Nonomuraea solani TaxID=1144553 RepID=UPI0011B0780A|nr:M64 family metallopeptidase [Nonomuraea solani]
MAELVLFPSCDLHMALTGGPKLFVRLFSVDTLNTGRYALNPIFTGFAFDFFAPYRKVGERMLDLPRVAPTAANPQLIEVTATRPGVYLFQFRVGPDYLVGRLQVHNEIKAWWFGNDSITTAVDDVGHAQPSIYAEFSEDSAPGNPNSTGADLVGDITGHGYVTLTSPDPKVVVMPEGRLRGTAETPPATPVVISGTFLGKTHTLATHVVNYDTPRRILTPRHTPNLAGVNDAHNMLFLADGFREADKAHFEMVYTKAVQESVFGKPAHEPYPMLKDAFNVFTAFAPSRQHALTCGYRVTDTASGRVPKGAQIPYIFRANGNKNAYTLEELIGIVGDPMHNEQRGDLVNLWKDQSLPGFQPEKVDDDLLAAWKVHRSTGILQARDTFFGMIIGSRPGDRHTDRPSVNPPPKDEKTQALADFVKRVYEFYRPADEARLVTPDRRRHAPEVLPSNRFTSTQSTIMRFIRNLQLDRAPNTPIGPVWDPFPTFKRSRGLVGMICHDGMDGGGNVNDNTMTTVTVGTATDLTAAYVPTPPPPAAPESLHKRVRQPPSPIEPDIDDVAGTIAHEFGHSFNLSDEYETRPNDDPEDAGVADLTGDNVSKIKFLQAPSLPAPAIDPAKVKWLTLPRIRVSSRLIARSTAGTATGIRLPIDPGQVGQWRKLMSESPAPLVHLRNFAPDVSGRQLPLSLTLYLDKLMIQDVTPEGVLILLGPGLDQSPVFEAGSAVFVPVADKNQQPVTITVPKVLQQLTTSHKPLNEDLNNTDPKDAPDEPVSISGFKPPCTSSLLIGVFEGAQFYARGYYRPTGTCKMRSIGATGEAVPFCYVCKWLLVNRVDPSYHAKLYDTFYPEAKKNG